MEKGLEDDQPFALEIGREINPTEKGNKKKPNSVLFLPESWFSGKGLFLKGTRNYYCWDPLITSMIMGGRIVGNTMTSEQGFFQ